MSSLKPPHKAAGPAFRLGEFLPYLLANLSRDVAESFAADHANRFGLTGPQWRVLAVLGEAEGPLSGAEVARRAAVNLVMGHRAIEGLLQGDLVLQRENAADRRKSSLVLSRKGREVYRKLTSIALSFEDELLSVLSPDERAALRSMVRRLIDGLRPHSADGDVQA